MKWQVITHFLYRSCVMALLSVICSSNAFANSAEDSLEAILTESLEEEFISVHMFQIDLVLHDVDGKEIKRDQSNNREPELVFKPVETQTFYVAVYAADIEKDKSWVALAVTYR